MLSRRNYFKLHSKIKKKKCILYLTTLIVSFSFKTVKLSKDELAANVPIPAAHNFIQRRIKS